MRVVDDIRKRLEGALEPDHLEITDESARHVGHAGAREGGESHFRVTVVARAFAGRSRLQRQRLVHEALGDLMDAQIHALALRATAPGEDVPDR